ncbi:MAG: thioredoxin family protein [Acidobacteriota bacterium]
MLSGPGQLTILGRLFSASILSKLTIVLGVSLALVFAASAAEEAPAELEWSDTTRDVYVDGELKLDVLTLWQNTEELGPRMAVWGESLGRAYVVDLTSLDVGELSLSSFEFHATGAKSPADLELVSVGRVTPVRDRRSLFHVVSAGERTLVISPHQGTAGPILLEELFDAAPSWQRRAADYEASDEAVDALRKLDRETEVTVVLGTWCGDSRNYVPKLLRAIEDADNPNLRLDLVSIHRGFNEPAEIIRSQRVTNVPTVIVRQGEEEIGRIVETPAAPTIEQDLAAILEGQQESHPGRWQRQEEIARGRYVYHGGDDRPVGEERWKLFETEGGGRLLHSLVERDGHQVEIWHRRGAEGASEFVELTRRDGDELSRTRIWINDDGQLRALTRGNSTGIVEQRLEVPSGTSFMLPCAADAGFDRLRLGESVSRASASRFLLTADQPAAGKVIELQTVAEGREVVAASYGEVSALKFGTQYGGASALWWLDEELGVPVRGDAAGLGKVTLEELVVASN